MASSWSNALFDHNISSENETCYYRPKMGEAVTKKTWGRWVWLIYLALAVFPPVGIALIWRNDNFAYNTRVALTVVGVVIFFGLLGLGQFLSPDPGVVGG